MQANLRVLVMMPKSIMAGWYYWPGKRETPMREGLWNSGNSPYVVIIWIICYTNEYYDLVVGALSRQWLFHQKPGPNSSTHSHVPCLHYLYHCVVGWQWNIIWLLVLWVIVVEFQCRSGHPSRRLYFLFWSSFVDLVRLISGAVIVLRTCWFSSVVNYCVFQIELVFQRCWLDRWSLIFFLRRGGIN